MDDKIVEQTTVTKSPSGSVKTTTISRQGLSISNFFVSKTNQIIFAFILIIDLVIVVRLFLFLFSANQVGFATYIISLSDFFVGPFKGIFPSTVLLGNGYLEVASIFAILAITIGGFVLGTVIDLFSSNTD